MCPQKTFVYLVMVFQKIDSKGKSQKHCLIVEQLHCSIVTTVCEYTGYVCFLEFVRLTLAF